MVEGDALEKMRALERLRSVETRLLERVDPLRRWLISDLEAHCARCAVEPLPVEVIALLGQPEAWWRAPAPDSGAQTPASTLLRFPVIGEALALLAVACPRHYHPSRNAHGGIELGPLVDPAMELLLKREDLVRRAGING